MRRVLYVSHHALGIRAVWVYQQSDQTGLGKQLGKQFDALGVQLDGEDADTREVAARPGKTGD